MSLAATGRRGAGAGAGAGATGGSDYAFPGLFQAEWGRVTPGAKAPVRTFLRTRGGTVSGRWWGRGRRGCSITEERVS